MTRDEWDNWQRMPKGDLCKGDRVVLVFPRLFEDPNEIERGDVLAGHRGRVVSFHRMRPGPNAAVALVIFDGEEHSRTVNTAKLRVLGAVDQMASLVRAPADPPPPPEPAPEYGPPLLARLYSLWKLFWRTP